jgi:hypothetical protein
MRAFHGCGMLRSDVLARATFCSHFFSGCCSSVTSSISYEQ